MVVAQLAKCMLPISEVHSSNPVIGKVFNEHCLLSTVLKRRKIKKKRPWKAHFYKKANSSIFLSNHEKVKMAFLGFKPRAAGDEGSTELWWPPVSDLHLSFLWVANELESVAPSQSFFIWNSLLRANFKSCYQCDQIGNFWKFFTTNLATKIAQIFDDLWGLIWNKLLFE